MHQALWVLIELLIKANTVISQPVLYTLIQHFSYRLDTKIYLFHFWEHDESKILFGTLIFFHR